MDRPTFDGITQALGAKRDRRAALRLLAGLALGAALPVAAAPSKPAAAATCKRGAQIDMLQVPADGSRVKSRRLLDGQKYRVRVSGAIKDGPDWSMDAEYYFNPADPTNNEYIYDACDPPDAEDVGLSINDAKIDKRKSPRWGKYTADHAYETVVTGRGKPLSLRLHDCYFPGNTGALKVEIFCA